MNEVFTKSSHKITYAGENFRPLFFQYDVMRACTTYESLIRGNLMMEQVKESIFLDFNLSK